jgi:hypothetical protein
VRTCKKKAAINKQNTFVSSNSPKKMCKRPILWALLPSQVET